jgi:hypothetical protein
MTRRITRVVIEVVGTVLFVVFAFQSLMPFPVRDDSQPHHFYGVKADRKSSSSHLHISSTVKGQCDFASLYCAVEG